MRRVSTLAVGLALGAAACASSMQRSGITMPRAGGQDGPARIPASTPITQDPAGSHEHDDPVEPALLSRPQPLHEGIGPVHQEITVAIGDPSEAVKARAYFDQGLSFLHGYVWIEAARAFHEVLRRDPECAMAWVGLSRAESGLTRKAEARAALEQARARVAASGDSGRATPLERRFVELRALQLDAMDARDAKDETGASAAAPAASAPDRAGELHAQYKRALDDAIREFPEDVELRMLRGNAEESSPAGIGQGATAASIVWYEGVLTRSSEHPGAFHCLTHAYENCGDHATALERGAQYRRLAPQIPHAWHMCGHDLPRLGKWDEALAMFTRAEELSRDYELRERTRPGDEWHRQHNLLLLAYTELRLGTPTALDRFRQQYETPIRNRRYEYTHACRVEALLFLHRLDEAQAVALDLQRHENTPAARAAGVALEGELALRAGDVERARLALPRCEAALAEHDALFPGSTRPSPRSARVYATVLSGLLDLHGGDVARGEKALLALADEVAANPHFDAWGEGLFRIARVWRFARELGRDALATQLLERMRRLDPRFDPAAAAPTGA
jgi:tetratricopeptide (TPR) repeat protein